MKTIEERVDAWLYRTIPVTPEGFKQRLEGALTELADDLNAEKEKEVAELRGELAEAKRVLGLINYGEHDNPNDEGNGPCLCSQCQFVRAKRQLLTRLGGSHE